MIRVEIEPNGRELELPAGERLLDVLDDVPQPDTPLSCRGATCGTCRVRVLAGQDALQAARPDEVRTLTRLGAAHDERLACQIAARPDAGSSCVVLRWVAQ